MPHSLRAVANTIHQNFSQFPSAAHSSTS